VSVFEKLYDLATGDDDARLCKDIPAGQCNDQPVNFVLQTASQALSKTGDALADAKVVLPWLIGAVGAPLFLIGFLVPIRESLALLPQILVGGMLRRHAVRKYFGVVFFAAQGLCVLGMALVGLSGMTGAAAGWTIIGLLTLFSLSRGIVSIASKDVLGKTVSKTRRGRVNGYAGTISGVLAAFVGVYVALAPSEGRPDWLLYALLLGAAGLWFASAATYVRLVENPGATNGGRGFKELFGDQARLLLSDSDLRLFLYARALMISTALMGPLFVAMAQQRAGNDLSSLGWLMLSAGLAGAVSSSFWGRFSDTSSRMTMALGAGMAGGLGVGCLLLIAIAPSVATTVAFYAALLFLLSVAHSGVRIGRKTHIVDLAGKDNKSEYVALSNTIIGVLLLIVGAFSGAAMAFGLEVGIAALSVLALAGAALSTRMRNVQDA
jgi:hypothetical protein